MNSGLSPRKVRGWRDISEDPNSEAARRFRNEALKRAWAPPAPSRVEYLRRLVAGKRTLDVGVVDHTADNFEKNPVWLHRAIAESASYCLGIDILPGAVEGLREAGFNVRLCDFTKDPLDDLFDIIICGEVIEHVSAHGAFFEAAERNLAPGGRLVITTPNPYYAPVVFEALRGVLRPSVDHVSFLYPGAIAELAERSNIMLDRYRGILNENSLPMFRLPRKLWLISGLSKDSACLTMCYECVKPG